MAGDNAVKSTTVVTAVRGSAFPPTVALRVQFSYFSCALSLRVSFSISSFMIKRRSARISSCARVPILVENGQLLPQLLPCMFSFHTFRIHCHFMFLFPCHVFGTYACSPQYQKIKIKTKHEVLYTYILSWKSWNFSIFGLCQFWNFPFLVSHVDDADHGSRLDRPRNLLLETSRMRRICSWIAGMHYLSDAMVGYHMRKRIEEFLTLEVLLNRKV